MADRFAVMREDVSLIYARESGGARNATTVLTAISAIGATPRLLVLSDDGNGVWTFDTNVTVPDTITLVVPVTVTVTGTGNLTLQGGLIAYRSNWYQGSGVLSMAPTGTQMLRVAKLQAQQLALDTPLPVPSGGTGGSTPAEARVLLGLEIGVNVQAQDPQLEALAATTPVVESVPYFLNSTTASTTPFPSFSRALVGAATAADARNTLLLGTVALLNSIGTTELAAQAVTYAKMQPMSASRLLGNATGGSDVPQEIALSGGLAFTGGNTVTIGALNITDVNDSYIAGQLGIAVPSPAYALDVNGRVHTNGTLITETTGDGQVGFQCELLSAGGTGRAAINCTGTAQSFFGGFVHIAAGRGLGIGSTIGTALSFSLHLFAGETAGKPGGGEWSDSSTRQMKKDIRDIPDALETLLTLRGRNFEWDDAEHKAALPGKQWGFVAEEVEETPLAQLWVSEDFIGRKALTIRGFNALAVEAIRVLEQRLTALEAAAP